MILPSGSYELEASKVTPWPVTGADGVYANAATGGTDGLKFDASQKRPRSATAPSTTMVTTTMATIFRADRPVAFTPGGLGGSGIPAGIGG